MTRSEFEKKCYEAYKLDWMLSHGYTLKDYLDALILEDEEASAAGEYPEGDTRDIFESLDASFEYNAGFACGSGEIWACKDEFLGAEFKDIDYMEHLISLMPNSKEMEDFWRVIYGISKEVKPGVEVYTSAGVIRAYENPDVDQPGICVMFQPSGYEDEIDAAFVSVYEDPEYASDGERPVDVAIMSYGNAATEEYTTKEVIRREDVVTALGDAEIKEDQE